MELNGPISYLVLLFSCTTGCKNVQDLNFFLNMSGRFFFFFFLQKDDSLDSKLNIFSEFFGKFFHIFFLFFIFFLYMVSVTAGLSHHGLCG